MARKPVVAGQFYAGERSRLLKQIEDCFNSEFGPGKGLIAEKGKKIIGIISPHAGYMFSGAAAAWGYKAIKESNFKGTFVLLGLSHSGYGTCLSMEDWETPLGIVKNDVEFQKVASKFLPGDERPHNREHSIEVQIPFLQYIMAGKADDNFKIAPIIASPDIDYKEIADAIFNTIKKAKRNVMIIASSDFTHYGFNYGYLPFTRNAKENMQKLDMGAIEKIEKLDAIGFLEYTDKTGATICGKYPIAVLIELCKKLGAKKASLLKYYTSGDVTGDYSSAVGYASIMIS